MANWSKMTAYLYKLLATKYYVQRNCNCTVERIDWHLLWDILPCEKRGIESQKGTQDCYSRIKDSCQLFQI